MFGANIAKQWWCDVSDNDTSTYADERRRTVHELERERNQLLRNIETCRIRDIDHPLVGDWSLKDIVAHVASWEAEVVFALKQIAAGHHPALLSFDQSTLDAWNADHVERMRGVDFFAVLQRLNAGRERLLDALETFEDEAVGAEGTPVHSLLRYTIDHDREHWHHIAARLAGMAGVRSEGTAPTVVPRPVS